MRECCKQNPVNSQTSPARLCRNGFWVPWVMHGDQLGDPNLLHVHSSQATAAPCCHYLSKRIAAAAMQVGGHSQASLPFHTIQTVVALIFNCVCLAGQGPGSSPASRYRCRTSFAGSPALPASSSPADMMIGSTFMALNDRVTWKVLP